MPSKIKNSHFENVEKIGENLVSEVFSARDKQTKTQLLIRKVKPDFLFEGIKDYIEQQIQHLKRLDIADLLIPESQISDDNNLYLIQPYPPGETLRNWLSEQTQIEISTILEVGISLLDGVAVRHRSALVHKGIKPDNVRIQQGPIRIQLMNEVQITDRAKYSGFVNNPYYLRETLPYNAPEMSGRIRAHVDYSSDLYSVGIVLYECITGTPPFLSDDPLSIVHSHLAEQPRPVAELNKNCPEILGDIISTLLQKQPEKRYQSATGLRADLQTCLSTLKISPSDPSKVVIPAFQLREHESSHQISIPSIMVGREVEQKQLLDEYQRICTGKLGIVMLSGLSGIGKTRLIQELELPIVAKRGNFTFGKFNQFSTHLPYSTLLGAFSRLIRQILSANSEHIQYWRERMLDVLGANGKLVTDIVPELETIIGKQPEVQPLPANDARNRFTDLFSRFMSCLATETHPLVLFIDDMQWCDDATLDLLEFIYSQPENHPYLLIIGAYRSNEVDENHPVHQMESMIEQSSQPILKLKLEPLEQAAVNQMVGHILNTSPSRTEELTNGIHPITGGNPLYVSESLRWLHQNDRLQLAENGKWEWDDSDITGEDIPSDITGLFVEKMMGFSPKVRDLLATGALLGAQFEGVDLANIAQIPRVELYSALSEVFAQRILHVDKGRLYFVHDQIQAAAADFLDEEQRKQRHRVIARSYIERINPGKSQATIPTATLFSIVEHMAAGRLEQATAEERLEEARFNYLAGVAALESLAHDAGNHYLNQCAELCPQSMWDDDYPFMLALYKKLAHAALLNADQARAATVVGISMRYARTNFDKADFLYEQSVACAALGDLPQAIDIVSRALALLELPLPTHDDEIQQEIEAMEARIHDKDRDFLAEVIDSPHADSPFSVLVHKLYGELLGYFFFSGQTEMTRLTAYRAIDCSVEFGSDDFVCYALGCIAYILVGDRNYTLAYQYEAATIELIKQYPDTFGSVKAKGAILWATMHLRQPISDLRSYGGETAVEGIRCGELRYGVLSKCVEHWFGYVQGNDLPLLNNELEKMNSFSQQCNLALSLAIGEAIQLSLRPLLGEDESIQSTWDDQEVADTIQQWNDDGMMVATASYYTFSGIVCYYNHQPVEAEQFLDLAEPLLPALSTGIVEKMWYVFRHLIGLKMGFKNDQETHLDRLTEWSAEGPMLAPYMMLIEAETVVTQGDFKSTRYQYLDAIDSANQARYVLLEAFLNERLSSHLYGHNHHTAESYRNRANFLYKSCGVVNRTAKPVQSILDIPNNRSAIEPIDKTGTPRSVQDVNSDLDVRFLFDAVKSISSELDLDKLMGTILSSVMARLGAKNGYLLIAEDNLLQPVFKGIKYEEVTIISRGEDSFNTDTLSMAITNYVFNSKESVILDSAVEAGDFVTDRVVLAHHLQSVLCIPIVMQNNVLGILYFENSLIKSAFTEEQIDQADLLTSQAAIALQNSKLLHETRLAQNAIEEMNRDLEHKVEERTQELQKKQLELTHAGRLASLGELSTGIAHELGQPLQIMQVASRIIQDELESDDFDGATLIPFTRDIAEQIERATAIVSNMRSYARNDDNKDAERTDLSEPFNQCLVFFTEQFHQHQIELILEIAQNLPDVLVNPQKFQQIVVNLLSNARYAVDHAAENRVDEPDKKITARLYPSADNQFVVLEVKDNGIGMTEEVLQKCREPFYTTKQAGEGTGLGLSIVHSLVKEFGFTLEIISEANKGSLFTVTMPTHHAI
ncbi:MAG: AAA family ATPase [Pseudomonadales bacterium]|nr:AAA family ATPase [Pseudomonadales bacterium]